MHRHSQATSYTGYSGRPINLWEKIKFMRVFFLSKQNMSSIELLGMKYTFRYLLKAIYCSRVPIRLVFMKTAVTQPKEKNTR